MESDNNVSDKANVKEDKAMSDSEFSSEQELQVNVTKDVKSSEDTQKESKKEHYIELSAIKSNGNLKVDTALEDLNIVVKEFTQSDEKKPKPLKPEMKKPL